MSDIIGSVGAGGKDSASADAVIIALDGVESAAVPDGSRALADVVATVRRLARAQIVHEALLAALDGRAGRRDRRRGWVCRPRAAGRH